MITDINYRFKTNISTDSYEKKSDATACLSKAGAKAIGKSKMAFREQNVSVTEFLGYATTGHSFCGLFEFDPNKKYLRKVYDKWQSCYPVYHNGANKGCMKLSFKSDEYFKGTQTVFVDVDYTNFKSIEDYVVPLSLKPTCGYYSYSDMKDKNGICSRRFRLVYVFYEILNKTDLQRISCAIHNHIVLCTKEPMEDYCGTRISQYMNGVYGNKDTYQSDIIYSIEDFREFDIISFGDETDSSEIEFNSQFLYDMGTMSYQDFTHRYSWKYRYFYRTERDDWTDDIYQYTDDKYLQLWYYREKVKDGHHRRRKLFQNACVRRLIWPDVDPDTLIYNLYIDLWRFFDNSDGVITLDVLKRKVINAFKMGQDQLTDFCSYELDYWKEHKPKFIINHKIKVDIPTLNSITKNVRYQEIYQAYDQSLSITENIENGLDVPLCTLYRFCKEYGINPNPCKGVTKVEQRRIKKEAHQQQIDLFMQLYDPQLTLQENQKTLSENGLELCLETIRTWKNRYYDTPNDMSQTGIWQVDSFFMPPRIKQEMRSTLTDFEWICDWDVARTTNL